MKKDLSLNDLVTLHNSDGEQLEPGDLVEIESYVRLRNFGIIAIDGTLSTKGKTLYNRLEAYEQRLKSGIPFDLRKGGTKTRAYNTPGRTGWMTIAISPKKYISSNGEAIIVNAKVPKRKLVNAPASSKVRLRNAFARLQKFLDDGERIQLTPFLYQIECLGGVEVIVFEDENKNRIAIQAKYYDLIEKKGLTAVTSQTWDAVYFIYDTTRYKRLAGIVLPFMWE